MTTRSEVWCPNHCATETPWQVDLFSTLSYDTWQHARWVGSL